MEMIRLEKFLIRCLDRIDFKVRRLRDKLIFRANKRKAINYLAGRLSEEEWSRDRFSTVVDNAYENLRSKEF